VLNISIMVDRPCAVHCDSEEQGKAIVDAIREFYPEMAKLWNSDNNDHWSYYGDRTCYTLYDECYEGGLELDRLYYCNRTFYEDHGYEILEFEDLLTTDVEIVESDMLLEEFLGI